MTNCSCNMFIRNGICWHTGYKPTLKQEVKEDLPAVRRMKERIKHPTEIGEERDLRATR